MNEVMNRIFEPCSDIKQAESYSPLDNLKRQQKQLIERLNNVDEAIRALENNPEILKVLELLAKTR